MRRLVLLLLLVASQAHAAGAVAIVGCGGAGCINNLATGATNFFSARGQAAPVTTESATIESVVPMAGTAVSILCDLMTTGGAAGNPGSGKSYALTFRKNEADTALTCTISDLNTTCTLTGQAVSIAAGDRIDYKSIPASTPNGRVAKCAVEFDPS